MTGQHRAVIDRPPIIEVYRHLTAGLLQGPGRRTRCRRDVLLVAATVAVAVIVIVVVSVLTIAWRAIPEPAQPASRRPLQTVTVYAHCQPGFPPSGPYRICAGP